MEVTLFFKMKLIPDRASVFSKSTGPVPVLAWILGAACERAADVRLDVEIFAEA